MLLGKLSVLGLRSRKSSDVTRVNGASAIEHGRGKDKSCCWFSSFDDAVVELITLISLESLLGEDVEFNVKSPFSFRRLSCGGKPFVLCRVDRVLDCIDEDCADGYKHKVPSGLNGNGGASGIKIQPYIVVGS